MDNGGYFTDRLLAKVNIPPGATALDIGCGTGDVTLRLAERVGPSGKVIGLDTNAAALDIAKSRASEAGFRHVEFLKTTADDFGENPDLQGVDLVTCRRVLMYLPSKVETLRHMMAALCPGGHVVLQEHDGSILQSSSALPLNHRAQSLIWETVRAEGADTQIGLKLPALLSEAGAELLEVLAEAVVQTPTQSAPLSAIIAAMADRIVAAGTADRDEIDRLGGEVGHAALQAERQQSGASMIGEMIFGVIARKRA